MAQLLDSLLYSFDTSIFYFIGNLQSHALNIVADFVSMFGTPYAFAIYIIISCVLCAFPSKRKYGVALFFGLIVGAICTNLVLKPAVARPRPYVGLAGTDFWETYKEFYIFAGAKLESDMSFPSGHTTLAFDSAISLTLAGLSDKKKWIGYVLIPFACLIGLSRIYLMVHYPSDVITGFIVGVIAGIIGAYIAKALHLNSKKRKKEQKVLEALNHKEIS